MLFGVAPPFGADTANLGSLRTGATPDAGRGLTCGASAILCGERGPSQDEDELLSGSLTGEAARMDLAESTVAAATATRPGEYCLGDNEAVMGSAVEWTPTEAMFTVVPTPAKGVPMSLGTPCKEARVESGAMAATGGTAQSRFDGGAAGGVVGGSPTAPRKEPPVA